MTRLGKFALAGAMASVLVMAGGCASRYDDTGYYDNSGSYHDTWRDREHWRDRQDGQDWRDRSDSQKRVRVCDEDGDNCHWEYRDR